MVGDFGGEAILYGNISYYSTDIAAAWEVVHKFVPEPFEERPPNIKIVHNGFKWFVRVTIRQIAKTDGEKRATADTLPLAICRAALKAVSA